MPVGESWRVSAKIGATGKSDRGRFVNVRFETEMDPYLATHSEVNDRLRLIEPP